MRKKMFSIGINAHKNCDNLITLIRSSNDLQFGTLDYLFFKILNLTPVEYFNIVENDFEYSEEEIEVYEDEYFKSEKEELNKILREEIIEVVQFIRKKSLKLDMIKIVFIDKFIGNSINFNSEYIMKTILEYYNDKKRSN